MRVLSFFQPTHGHSHTLGLLALGAALASPCALAASAASDDTTAVNDNINAAATRALTTPPPSVLKSSNPMVRARPLRPGPPRYLENYSFLSDPAQRNDPFDSLRNIRLTPSAYLTLGGGIRYRYESLHNPGYGLSGVSRDSYWQQRLQAHADLHLFDDALRFFVEIDNTDSWSKETYSPFDQSDTEIEQAFMDVRLPAAENDSLTARLGRQEMGFGDLALIDTRNTPNVRQAFDGIRLAWRGNNGVKIDGFATHPVNNIRPGSFNDSSTDSGDFYGLYATVDWQPALSQDFIALGYSRDDRTLNGVTGNENRYTAGTRLFGKHEATDYSWNVMYQFGDHAGQDINAWGLMSTTGHTFTEASWKPRIGVVFDAASGDHDANDNSSNTFDPMFAANGKFFGNAGLTQLSNLIAVGPQLTFTPVKDVVISPTILALWRQSEDDYAYKPGMNAVAGSNDVSGKRLGTSYDLLTRWTPTNNLTFDIEYQYYAAGDVIERAGGEDTQYFSVRTYFLF
ncbi:alginate export family protein [Larsenimonas salina]|uniref:alginate export family protein n=1 Tax=Larsenimonas salina TaxID=1295565 RepID=UPI00207336F0|nr:alginate export family protein [Larsenimonas salina]MCM5704863.1 alginate export family protein [Larsenimonas salina]